MKTKQLDSSRIIEMDALRGIALLGILLVNIFVFHAPYLYYGEFYGAFEGFQASTVNAVVEFAGGKFLFIFAFLFGYGIAIQEQLHPNSFKAFFTKRMLVLLLFGVIHILIFWFGDILASYALLGLLVMPFLKLPNRLVLSFGILFVFFRPIYYLGVVAFDWPLIHMHKPAELTEFLTVFQEGTYGEVFRLRMSEFWAFIPENLVWYLPKTIGLLLIGIYAGRNSMFSRIRKNQALFGIVSLVMVASSVVWIWFKMDVFNSIDLEATPIWRPVLIGINVLFETAMGIGYIVGFTLVFQNSKLITGALAKTGRLALTNYITQSLICVFIFYSYGLGLYGELVPTDLVLISVLIFCFNLIFSTLYLKSFNVGPLEFLWRKLIGIK